MSDTERTDPDDGSIPPGDDPRIPTRPLWGFALVLAPVVGVFLVGLAYVVIGSLGLAGRSAQGAAVTWRFDGCHDARPFLEARLADVGLPAEWSDAPGGYAVKTQLTGDEAVDRALPETLVRRSKLEVYGGDAVLLDSADVTEASVRMDVFMVPYVLLSLDEGAAQRVKQHVRADPEGRLSFVVDGRTIGWQSNRNPVEVGSLEINLELDGDEQARMQAAAEWSVVLDHGPLPCTVNFRGETPDPG